MFKLFAIMLVLVFCPLKLLAGIESFDFSSDENRLRYQTLAEELRCPKCKNSNLADSNSMIATDLKREIHTMVEAGKSDPEIIDFMRNRYGDFVLYRPRIAKDTLILWGAPVVMLLLGLSVVVVIVWRRGKRNASNSHELSAAELAKLTEALSLGDGTSTPSKNNS